MTRSARALLYGLLVHVLAIGAVQARMIEVGAAFAFRTPAAVPWASLAPGDEVVVHAGVYRDLVMITSKGSPTLPIVVRAEGVVVIENSVLFEGARHVVVRGFTIRKSQLSAFILRRGAAFDTVENSIVEDSALGVWIGDGSGGGHRILNNTLSNTRTHGIAVDMINNKPGEETLISGNRVSRNVMHGMEINGSRYIIEHNIVWQNGIGLSGTSGIHTFSRGPTQGTGSHNIIRYNIVSGQQETDGQDGNGIQLDQWCDNNEVYFNATFANDGAGIVAFDAANNIIANNTLFDNMRDSRGKHAYKADLVIASDYTKNVDHSFGNVVRNNLIYTHRPNIYSIYVDRFSAKNTKEIANNMMFRQERGVGLYFWGGAAGHDIAAWNALKPGAADLLADPLLADIALARNDLAGVKGLIPRRGSPAGNAGIALPAAFGRDLAGTPIQRLPIGAYAPPAN